MFPTVRIATRPANGKLRTRNTTRHDPLRALRRPPVPGMRWLLHTLRVDFVSLLRRRAALLRPVPSDQRAVHLRLN